LAALAGVSSSSSSISSGPTPGVAPTSKLAFALSSPSVLFCESTNSVQGCGVWPSEATDCSRFPTFFCVFFDGCDFLETAVDFLLLASFCLSFSGFGHSTSRSKSILVTGTHSSNRLLKLSKLQ
jgi:hypothetical protein